MRYVKPALRFTGLFVGLVLIYLIALLAYGTWTDFQPQGIKPIEPIRPAATASIEDSVLSVVIWNIGYTGLGEESDFFYHGGAGFLFAGGKMVRPDRPVVEKNLAGVVNLAHNTKADFFLFQEVDSCSKRSYFLNHLDSIGQALPGFGTYYAVNYNVNRVAIPIFEPWRAYGKAHSGLATFSKYAPSSAERVQLPGNYAWPNRIFQLDRCAAVFRYPTKNEKELVLVNIHNSAFDKSGKIKAQQMAYLQSFFLEEYEKGNYVLAGGDWNQCPPFFEFDSFMPGNAQGHSQFNIDPAFLPEEWRWVYDPMTPTNRKTDNPYVKGESFITTIDFFLISPNIKVRQVRVINQDFQFSDHQPVWMEVELL
ncbi:MAG: endonuclease/exonuclease/phosphatase family protein [Saprospirales bacterium]|nr:endonuclease/exonuclease/phosphatase family protein [Saprospirales bacterium]